MSNYFNTLSLHGKLDQLGKCRSMSRDEFKDGCNFLRARRLSSSAAARRASTRAST